MQGMKLKLPIMLALAGCLAGLAGAEDVTVTAATVTEVRSVDMGLKTFVQNALSSPVTESLEAGESFTVEVFDLFTDEAKVNTEEDDMGGQGDETPFPIEATVTLGPPANTVLTFEGVTFGEEDVSVVPPNLQPILEKENPTFFEALQLAQWAQDNPDDAKLAGGRGVVQWSGPQEAPLGDGRKIVVELQDAFYDEGMQFTGAGAGYGTGPANAGTVEAVVTYELSTTPDERPIIRQIALVGDQVEVRVPSQTGFSYSLETSFTGEDENWTPLAGSARDGTGGELVFNVPRDENQPVLLVHVVRTPKN